MADAPTPTAAAPSAAGSSSEATSDAHLGRLSRLHRMSRTAGLGSNEYTAVNTAAVVAVLIGAASALALVTPVFLFLPVVGVIVAAMAVAQIRSSNGTQTGLALALLALVLSVGLSGVTGYQFLRGRAQEHADVGTLNDLTGRFGALVGRKDYDGAYELTDARFQDQVKAADFRRRFEELSQSPATGSVTGFRTTGLYGIEADPESDQRRLAVGNALIDTQKISGGSQFRLEMRYRYTDETWRIFSIPTLFAAKAAPGAGGSAGTGAGGAGGGGPVGPPAPR